MTFSWLKTQTKKLHQQITSLCEDRKWSGMLLSSNTHLQDPVDKQRAWSCRLGFLMRGPLSPLVSVLKWALTWVWSWCYRHLSISSKTPATYSLPALCHVFLTAESLKIWASHSPATCCRLAVEWSALLLPSLKNDSIHSTSKTATDNPLQKASVSPYWKYVSELPEGWDS